MIGQLNLHNMNYKGLLNLKGAGICGDLEERHPPIALPKQSSDSALLAVDIEGTLIKLVYFEDNSEVKSHGMAIKGQCRFMKFQTICLDECLDFLHSKKLLYSREFAAGSTSMNVDIKATGGGSFKFADIFKEKLGASLDNLNEMDAVVTGANFLLKKIPYESFTFMHGKRTPVGVDQKNLFPYFLVNIFSGVSTIKFVGDGKQEVLNWSLTHIGGETMFGLAKLLTGCTRYEFLQLSQQGDNFVLDLIVKDICGELVCQKEGLSTSTLVSSFGKVLSARIKLSAYKLRIFPQQY